MIKTGQYVVIGVRWDTLDDRGNLITFSLCPTPGWEYPDRLMLPNELPDLVVGWGELQPDGRSEFWSRNPINTRVEITEDLVEFHGIHTRIPLEKCGEIDGDSGIVREAKAFTIIKWTMKGLGPEVEGKGGSMWRCW